MTAYTDLALLVQQHEGAGVGTVAIETLKQILSDHEYDNTTRIIMNMLVQHVDATPTKPAEGVDMGQQHIYWSNMMKWQDERDAIVLLINLRSGRALISDFVSIEALYPEL